jgi:hypothetical protein
MITKQIISTQKTNDNLEFIVKVSIPLQEISEEMANDCVNMFTREFSIPVERHIAFKVNEDTGIETINITVEPKNS